LFVLKGAIVFCKVVIAMKNRIDICGKRQKKFKKRSNLVIFSMVFSMFWVVLAAQSISFGALPARIIVEAGEYIRIDTPVSVGLDEVAVPLDRELRLEEIKGSERLAVPCQIEAGYSPRLWWILSGTTPAGGKRIYELSEGPAAKAPGVEITKDDACLEVQIGDDSILRYNNGIVQPPEGASPLYARSGFIHPLWSPNGQVLSRIHPPDHIHHIGLWNPWTKTEFEGRVVDFWNLGEGQGTVRFVRFVSTTEGAVFGGFRAIQEHVVLKGPEGEKVAINEELDVRAWNIGGADKGRWLWDFTTTQNCASSSPITLDQYRYGGLGFRAREGWEKGDYLTSEGKTGKDGDGTRARWCSVFGPTDKGPAGVLFMSNPHNREHPEPIRIWGPGFNDLFFNFCPIKQKSWVLEPKKDYVLKYRIFAYDGELTSDRAEQLWRDFAYPPKTIVEGKLP